MLLLKLRPASCGLIAAAGLSVVSLALLNLNGAPAEWFQWKYIALAAVILVLTRWVKPTKKAASHCVYSRLRRRRNSLRRAGDIRDPKMHENTPPGSAFQAPPGGDFSPKQTVFLRFSDSPRSGCAHYQYRRIGCPPCQGKPAVRRGFRKHSSALSAADRSGLPQRHSLPGSLL